MKVAKIFKSNQVCFWILFLIKKINLIGTCPNGYKFQDGNQQETDSDFARHPSVTKDQCAILCDGTEECLSFEYSKSTKLCILRAIFEPTEDENHDFVFCTKIGKLIGKNYFKSYSIKVFVFICIHCP